MRDFLVKQLVKLVFIFISFFSFYLDANAQVEPPDKRFLFNEDRTRKVRTQKRKKELAQKRKQAGSSKLLKNSDLPFDISASTIDYDTSGSILTAAGNVIVSYSTMIAEASEVKVNTKTNEASMTKDVRISDIDANMTAESAYMNLDSGQGKLEDVSLFFTEGNYRVQAKEVEKLQGEEYRLKDAVLTTCNCPEGEDCRPWSLSTGETKIERNGYGEAWNSSLRVYDYPVFYIPYLYFPAKSERQSGFLPATFGPSRRTGFALRLPYFWAINDSTDATLTGIYESKVRTGLDVEVRKLFLGNNTLQAGAVYLDESQRKGRLLGTNLTGFSDTDIGKERLAGYYNQSWNGKVANQPFQMIADGHYVSDDLIPREYQNEMIAEQNARFVTSTAVLRTPVLDNYSLDLSSEYNQSIFTSDKLVFQRLPELTLSGLDFFRPFGESKYGLRTVVNHSISSTNFTREQDYTGSRHEIYEQAKVPFFIGNYLDGSIDGGLRLSSYQLSNPDISDPNVPGSGLLADILPDSSSRVLPTAGAQVGTTFEKVFPVEEGNIFKYIGELGSLGRSQELTRVKHTIEPGLRYLYIPDVDQSDNPQFDAQDRIAQRNVVTYSLTQRFFGRYKDRNKYLYGVEEAAPRPESLGGLKPEGPIDESVQFGVDPDVVQGYLAPQRGDASELLTLKLSQSYSMLDPEAVGAPNNPQLSDANIDMAVYPNEYVKLRGRTDFHTQTNQFSSYLMEGQLSNSRGDLVRSRMRFVDGNGSQQLLRQLESGFELRLTERLKFGYYGRYDDVIKDFIEQRGGVRINSACNCWMFDVMVIDQLNPDNTRLSFNITLMGLGELGNTLFQNVSRQNAITPGQ